MVWRYLLHDKFNNINYLPVILAILISFLSACATSYQSRVGSYTGGFDELHLEGDVWRVGFYGNGNTTIETVQTYWLFRCAELALQKGYEGFEILSNIQLVTPLVPGEYGPDEYSFKTVSGGMIFVPMYSPPVFKPRLEADIKLLRKPFEATPPKVFQASELLEALEPIVNAQEKCEKENICPHLHRYIFPKGKFENPKT